MNSNPFGSSVVLLAVGFGISILPTSGFALVKIMLAAFVGLG